MGVARTLHLTNAWHAASGGVRTFYRALLDGANRHQRHVAVVVPGDTTGVTPYGPWGRLYTVRAPRSPVFDRRYRLILPHQVLAGRFGAIGRILAREQPDVVEVCDKLTLCHVAGLIKRRPGLRPTVVGLSQERLDDAMRAYLGADRSGQAFSTRYLAAVYMRQFDAHIANSEYTAEELRRAVDHGGPMKPKLWRLRERIFVLPLGVDVEQFGASHGSFGIREDLRRTGGTVASRLVVFAGRLSPEKHAHWLMPILRAVVARGVDARLVIAGDGPLRSSIEAEAAALPGRVVFTGHLTDRRAFASLLASADVFLHPNPREPFGIGPLEAMASGTPVVVPEAGGVLSYATARNAWLAGASPDGLAAAVVQALTSPREMRTRAATALETAREFAWPIAVGRYFQAYDRIHAARLAGFRPADGLPVPAYRATGTPLMVS